MMNRNYFYASFFSLVLGIWACSSDSNDASTNSGGNTTTTEVPAVYKKIYGASSITTDGTYVYIKSNGLPDHKSPYYANTEWSSTMYVADTRPGFTQAPGNKIATFNYSFKIPLNPKLASTHTALGAATIGVAINGVPLFNQYQMQGTLITPSSGEYTSFDLYGGHPTPFNEYHYHIEPNALTTSKGSSALMGFLLDGFPVYGPMENGATLTSSNLDVYHGHTTATADYPNGIYHYHITADAPYINGNGYYGTPGTWSK
ncbi:YHYH protein [Flavobacterium sp.]|uniref:YHYH protein n=1 Tax=Flavobacterium sp. TaxID=239 RepID=UPI003D0A65D6